LCRPARTFTLRWTSRVKTAVITTKLCQHSKHGNARGADYFRIADHSEVGWATQYKGISRY
jgi:hypothetical protein